MLCLDLQDWIAEGLGILAFIDRGWWMVRKAAFHGWAPPEEVADRAADVRALYLDWLGKVRRSFPAIAEVENDFKVGEINGLDNFRLRFAETEKVVGEWKAPGPAMSPAMRHHDFTAEEAKELKALLAAPPGSPGKLSFVPESVPYINSENVG